jgi:hypothetical protein
LAEAKPLNRLVETRRIELPHCEPEKIAGLLAISFDAADSDQAVIASEMPQKQCAR